MECINIKPRVKPNVNYRLWVMTCPCRVTDCNKYSILVGMLIRGLAVPVRGRGYLGNLSTFPLMVL